MKIAILSDIHANCIAFDAVLADLKREKIKRVVCNGDAVQGGPQPAETVARLRALDCPIVMGNADNFLITGKAEEPLTEKQFAVRAWSFAQLSNDDRKFIASFQPTIEIALDERRLLCFHGSPHSFDEILLPSTPEEGFQRTLGAFKQFILTGGHTHLQMLRRMGDTFFFNPGSIGLANSPQHAKEKSKLDDWAEYAILSEDDGRLALEFRRVPFDVNALIAAYRSSGRPFAEEMIEQYRRT